MPSRTIALSEPHLAGREWDYVKDCLDSGWVSSVGSYVTKFEEMVAARAGTRYAVATVNGTSALHIALLLAGVQSGDEVIVSDLTFIAPANSVRYLDAWPVFIDCERDHWQIDTSRLEDFLARGCERRGGGTFNRSTGRRIAALLPVHVLGHPCDMEALLEIARRYEIPVLEDATESLGSLCHGGPTGSFGLMGCFSFNGNKILTTGGGGMIVTNDGHLADRAKYLTTQAKSHPLEYIHDEVGYNYRLTNIQAAMGCAQMEQLDDRLAAKKQIADFYRKNLEDIPFISWQKEAAWAVSNHWLPTLRCESNSSGLDARSLLASLDAKGIKTRPLWQPMHLSPAHRGSLLAGGGNSSETLFEEALSLPCSTTLAEEDLKRVVAEIKEAVSEHRGSVS